MKIKTSSSRKIVNAYEQNSFTSELFDDLRKKQYLRSLYQLVIKSYLDDNEKDELKTVSEISEYIENNIKNSIENPIYKIQLCAYCRHSLNVYDTYFKKKSRAKIKCPQCRNMNDLHSVEEEEDWSYPEGETNELLINMCNYDMLIREVHGLCNSCNIYEEIEVINLENNKNRTELELKTLINNLYCKECNEIYEILKLFRVNKSKELDFWENGYWLEWYVKQLCKLSYPHSVVEQGIIVNDDGLDVEIDVFLYKKRKTYGIECKGYFPTKKATVRDIADVLQYRDLVDHSILVITSDINPKARKLLVDNNVTLVTNNHIEQIGKILKKM
ncbi:MAG: restriction endonuclease [Candidatus Bathyarchaeota archaeon]|nr:restriction endonuclease [Candidatus Bathyarchaeota archaeon]